MGSVRSAIKKDTRVLVIEHYNLGNINGVCQEASAIALRIQGLLDPSGPSNMPFTDGPMDRDVGLPFF